MVAFLSPYVASKIVEVSFSILLCTYGALAVIALWRYRAWLPGRFLPLLAAASLFGLFFAPPPWRPCVLPLMLCLHGAVCAQAWRGADWFNRSLRMCNAFWLLWATMGTVEWLRV